MIEESIGFTVMAFVFVGLGLLLFASRISSRIRRLRDQAGTAIKKDGRIVSTIQSVTAKDEIGDLTRTLAAMLKQLQAQNEYRETMADNLEHEMRTPLAGISASLKNLEKELQAPNKQVQDYLSWALADVQRMESLLTAIRDATNLQEALKQGFMDTFDIGKAMTIWVEQGWRLSYPEVLFVFEPPDAEHFIHGDPDRLRQMIEKLIDNAVSFHIADTPITLTIETQARNFLMLQVCNQGPTIAVDMQGQVFNSMVSLRGNKKGLPHLGLGLYIVRAIAHYHGGTVQVNNNEGEHSGVCFEISLPEASPV